ncbi:MAG: hypothetical protein LBG87_08495 [Spirochaetaceae bacterium]|jgi:hypothetical protein|nr:hypothetical protein [Spirochaetaceae bacterium]
MRFKKITLDTMERCYSAGSISADGRVYAVFASESKDGPCYAYTGENFACRETVWEKAGGTMAFVPIPGKPGNFIAVQHFFPGFQSAGAKLVWGTRTAQGWKTVDLAPLPYVHRFDLFTVEDTVYIFAAILCGSKKDREDWSDPGKILVGELPAKPEDGAVFREISRNHTKNHGYCRGIWRNREAAFFTCEEGVFAALPPLTKTGAWQIDRLIARPVSEIALADLDGCGEDELITIEPFHGNQFAVYKKDKHTGYAVVWRYPREIDFAHTAVGCTLLGKPAVIGGVRRKNCELFVLTHEPGAGYKTEIIEEGVGTSNAAVIHESGRDIIIAANHTKNEAALYIVTEE